MIQELNLQEMNEVKGGVTPLEYCTTLLNLMAHNIGEGNGQEWTEDQIDNAIAAYYAHNCNRVLR